MDFPITELISVERTEQVKTFVYFSIANQSFMTSQLPLFPLQIVVFPGEELPLHIFEERYKQLINDCKISGSNFGIPVYINNRLDLGTEMELLQEVRSYPSGAKDIICKGKRVFRIQDFEYKAPGKSYAGGEVEFLQDVEKRSQRHTSQLIELINELYLHLEVPPPRINRKTFRSYTLAHKIGLSLQQEYALLKISSEEKRQEFLINHLLITIPVVQEMNRTKHTIELNGSFRNFDPLDFEDYKIGKI